MLRASQQPLFGYCTNSYSVRQECGAVDDTRCINYRFFCGFSCSTGARGRSQTLPVSSGRWGIKLQYSSGTLRAGAPITCLCGPTTALEWGHRVTQSMSQPKNPVSAFHYEATNICATLVDLVFNMEPKRITSVSPLFNCEKLCMLDTEFKPSSKALKTSYRARQKLLPSKRFYCVAGCDASLFLDEFTQ